METIPVDGGYDIGIYKDMVAIAYCYIYYLLNLFEP